MSVEKEGLTIYVVDAKDELKESQPFTVGYNPDWGTVDVYYDDKHLFSTDWDSNMFQLFTRAMQIWPCPTSGKTQEAES